MNKLFNIKARWPFPTQTSTGEIKMTYRMIAINMDTAKAEIIKEYDSEKEAQVRVNRMNNMVKINDIDNRIYIVSPKPTVEIPVL